MTNLIFSFIGLAPKEQQAGDLLRKPKRNFIYINEQICQLRVV
jgi:hypothetical protein